MSRIFDLCGEWTLLGADRDGKPVELRATVPGCVHTDLISNGIIENIYYRDNSKNIQWIENCDFTYEKSFFIDELLPCAYLELDGLDTYADIYLNGTHIGSAADKFIFSGDLVSESAGVALSRAHNEIHVGVNFDLVAFEIRRKAHAVQVKHR